MKISVVMHEILPNAPTYRPGRLVSATIITHNKYRRAAVAVRSLIPIGRFSLHHQSEPSFALLEHVSSLARCQYRGKAERCQLIAALKIESLLSSFFLQQLYFHHDITRCLGVQMGKEGTTHRLITPMEKSVLSLSYQLDHEQNHCQSVHKRRHL